MAANRQTYIHTHARAQCSHASVGLAQARPNKPVILKTAQMHQFISMMLNSGYLPSTLHRN